MKTKPNTEQFKLNKDPSDFLEGGAADIVDKPEKKPKVDSKPKKLIVQSVPYTKVHREQKIFRLSLDLIQELKKESYERSLKTGTRVTETELVERALRSYFDR
ncbi:MAG: hypothetical protein ABL903_19710 [Methylococcales bacterium]